MGIGYKFFVAENSVWTAAMEVCNESSSLSTWKYSREIKNEVVIEATGANMYGRSYTNQNFLAITYKLLDYRWPKQMRKKPPTIIVIRTTIGDAVEPTDIAHKNVIPESFRKLLSETDVYEMIMMVEQAYGGGGGVSYTNKASSHEALQKKFKEQIKQLFGAR